MPGMSDLIIYQKMYDYILYAYPIISRFPKQQRFVLGQRIEVVMLEIAERIVQANKLRNKRPVLFEIDILLEKLKLLIRLAKDLGMVSVRQYGLHCERLDEIGRLLGGWLKAA
jgi:hypothetical protein